ncbi:reverse transcriptase [Gossypium australe]|uniref:Reverse transcriptase n=1 Tax=Gossypium australe TaxID=47621 RepID=A0A5B6V821_9ROSI|nr:reverse transcriptase [Gossypium australe]
MSALCRATLLAWRDMRPNSCLVTFVLCMDVSGTPIQTTLRVIDANGVWTKNPTHVLDRRMVKKGNSAITEVLVEWENSFPKDATWESLEWIKSKFPQFDPW